MARDVFQRPSARHPKKKFVVRFFNDEWEVVPGLTKETDERNVVMELVAELLLYADGFRPATGQMDVRLLYVTLVQIEVTP